PDHINQYLLGANLEVELLQPPRQLSTDIRLAAGSAPAAHHRAHKLLVLRRALHEAPRLVIEILVDDNGAAGPQRGADTGQEIARPLHEREHPARPRAVRVLRRQRTLIEVDLVRLDPRVASRAEGIEKPGGAVDGDHPLADFGEVEGRIARPAADV